MRGQYRFYRRSITLYTGLSLVILLYDVIFCGSLCCFPTSQKFCFNFFFLESKLKVEVRLIPFPQVPLDTSRGVAAGKLYFVVQDGFLVETKLGSVFIDRNGKEHLGLEQYWQIYSCVLWVYKTQIVLKIVLNISIVNVRKQG